MDFDIQFWIKQISDQYQYLQSLLDQSATMHPDRFKMVWSSACGQLAYFIDRAHQLGYDY